DGESGTYRPLRLPRATFTESRRALPSLDDRRGGAHPDRAPRRRRRATPRPALLRERASGGARLPRRRGELPLRRLHGDPRAPHADPRDPHHRRHPRALPGAPRRRHRAGGRLAPELDAATRRGVRSVRQVRGAPAGAQPPAERVRPASGAGDALPDGARRVDHRAGRRGGVPLLVGLPARRGWTEPDPALRGEPRRVLRAGEGALLLRELRRSDGCRTRRGRLSYFGLAAPGFPPFISTRFTSNGLSLRFSGRCVSAGAQPTSPAFMCRSIVLPPGRVNLAS